MSNRTWDVREKMIDKYRNNIQDLDKLMKKVDTNMTEMQRLAKAQGIIDEIIQMHKNPELGANVQDVIEFEWYSMMVDWVLGFNAVKQELMEEAMAMKKELAVRTAKRLAE